MSVLRLLLDTFFMSIVGLTNNDPRNKMNTGLYLGRI
jgi:hypothetical protein